MLPTLVFILWAYGMYALISALTGRKGSRFRTRSPWRRYGWLGLAAGGAAGVGLVVVLAQSFDDQSHNLKLSGFLGTVWAEGWPNKVERRVEEPPVKPHAAGDQPVYALLHPGTSPAELAQEKTAPKPRLAHKPKLKAASPQAKGAKSAAQKPKKDQAAAKNKAKVAKKNTAPPPPAAKNSTPG